MPEIISRKEAKARGLKRFFTGKPCERGHISEGWAWGMSCIECFKIGILQRYYANHEASKARLRENSARERREDPSKGPRASTCLEAGEFGGGKETIERRGQKTQGSEFREGKKVRAGELPKKYCCE